MASLSKLRRKRGTVRAMVTRTINSIEATLEEETLVVDELLELTERLNVNFEIVRELDTKIEDLLSEDDLEEEISSTLDVLNKVTSTKFRVKAKIGGKAIDEHDRSTQSINRDEVEILQRTIVDDNFQRSPNVDARRRMTVKLPRLDVKKFDGDSSEWQGFWAQYRTAIHGSNDLTKTEKMVYLKSYLVGDALRSVLGLQLCDGNYDAAVKILKERFGRQDLVVNAHMNKLLSLPLVRNSSDVRSLRRLFDVCEVQVRSLESLNIASTMFGPLLCPVLMKSLPEDIAFEFNMKHCNGEWNVDDLLSFLRTVVEAKERTVAMVKRNEGTRWQREDTANEDRRRKDRPHPGSASALQITNDEKCLFCKKDHNSFKCHREPSFKSKVLKNERRCYVCFKTGHVSNACSVDEKCGKCRRNHHTSLCFAKVVKTVDETKKNSPVPESSLEDTVVSTTYSKSGFVLLQTANARLDTRKKTMVRILLDGGSETSFILEDVSRRNKLPVITEESVDVYTFGRSEPTSTIRRKVQVKLKAVNSEETIVLNAAETKTITAATIASPTKKLREELRRRNLPIAEVSSGSTGFDRKISLLIGSDFMWKVCTGNVERLTSTLVAIETLFGWCLQGVCSDVDEMRRENILLSSEEKVSKQMKAFWELEAIGIVDEDKSSSSDSALVEMFNKNTTFIDGRYVVALPWKEEKERLSSNYEVARRRLTYLSKKFQRDAEFYKRYCAVVDEQIRHNIAEKVSEFMDAPPLYYLPHQAVIREDKTSTKLRVVFDASSHTEGKPSLNDCLEVGPNLVPDLIAVLLNFRRRKYGFMADIKKAFLQIAVREEDRNALRFLWFKESWRPGDPLNVDEYRMTRVLFGATCSPFLLAATIRHHIAKYRERYPKIVAALETYLYVDDFIGSEATINKLCEVKEGATEIMKEAGMELTKWSSNSDCFGNESNVDEMPVSADMAAEKVLGLVWRRREDTFSFNVKNLLDFLLNTVDTKRTVLKAASRIFDPLGFVTPFTIRVKILFQRLWEKGLEWDSELDATDMKEWRSWCSELCALQDVDVERCFEDNAVADKEVHIFCDASELAYGAVAYIRMLFVDGTVETKLVLSKARVAPIKRLSLPRLELMGAVIASRLKLYLAKQIVDAEFYIWTDAMIVLHWVKGSSKKWKPFVANRIAEIHSSTDPNIWSHCKGVENPADKLTRGMPMKNLVVDEIWLKGPQWLRKGKEDWPQSSSIIVDKEVSMELRKVFVSAITTNIQEPVVDELKYSSLKRLLRVTALVFRFVNNCRTQRKQKGPLSVDEMSTSEMYWITHSQSKYFSEEINAIMKKKELPISSPVSAFKLFVDEYNVLRCSGRLQLSNVEECAKQPIVLPRDAHFTTLVIVDAHIRMKHMAVQSTLTQIKDRFFIPRGRQLVKSVLRKCVVCRRLNSKPYSEVYAPLPADRCSTSTPFQSVGVDFAGPLFDRRGEKVYVLLFTCASTRAVHLELVTSMNTDAAISAIKRFVGRRGIPSTIYSDNARTFKRVNVELTALWKCLSSTTFQDYLCGLKIQWKYIAERSPWWGGFWERMVRTVKVSLKKCIGRAALNFEEMATVLIECEAAINSRPLTFVFVDAEEPDPLTPAHFLIGRKCTSLPSTEIQEFPESSRSELFKRWQYRERMAEHFWKRWKAEYLLELRSAFVAKGKSSTKPAVGDIVLVKEDNVPRMQWSLARIVDVIVGKDNKIRACNVKLAKGSVVCRAIQRLYPLEVSSNLDGTSSVSMAGGCCESSTNLENSGIIGAEVKRARDLLSADTSAKVLEASRNIEAEDRFACDVVINEASTRV